MIRFFVMPDATLSRYRLIEVRSNLREGEAPYDLIVDSEGDEDSPPSLEIVAVVRHGCETARRVRELVEMANSGWAAHAAAAMFARRTNGGYTDEEPF